MHHPLQRKGKKILSMQFVRCWIHIKDVLDPALLTNFYALYPDRPAPKPRGHSRNSQTKWYSVSSGNTVWSFVVWTKVRILQYWNLITYLKSKFFCHLFTFSYKCNMMLIITSHFCIVSHEETARPWWLEHRLSICFFFFHRASNPEEEWASERGLIEDLLPNDIQELRRQKLKYYKFKYWNCSMFIIV